MKILSTSQKDIRVGHHSVEWVRVLLRNANSSKQSLGRIQKTTQLSLRFCRNMSKVLNFSNFWPAFPLPAVTPEWTLSLPLPHLCCAHGQHPERCACSACSKDPASLLAPVHTSQLPLANFIFEAVNLFFRISFSQLQHICPLEGTASHCLYFSLSFGWLLDMPTLNTTLFNSKLQLEDKCMTQIYQVAKPCGIVAAGHCSRLHFSRKWRDTTT